MDHLSPAFNAPVAFPHHPDSFHGLSVGLFFDACFHASLKGSKDNSRSGSPGPRDWRWTSNSCSGRSVGFNPTHTSDGGRAFRSPGVVWGFGALVARSLLFSRGVLSCDERTLGPELWPSHSPIFFHLKSISYFNQLTTFFSGDALEPPVDT